MKKCFSITAVAVLFLTVTSCKKATTVTTTIPVAPIVVTPLVTLPQGWKISTTIGTSFPTGVQVLEFDSIYLNQKIKAFCVAYDSKNTNLEFKPIIATAGKTVTTFAADEVATGSTVYATINGGFFGSGQSFSLVEYNNVVASANIKVLNRTFNSVLTPYYPTRAAFGVTSTGTPSVGWVYSVGTGNDLIYNYPTPSPNALNVAPQAVPTATFPANGTIWNVSSAIGGSPMLLKNNSINITDAEELIVIDNTSSRARSAIGYNQNGIVLIMAVEGGNPPNNGINLADLASLMRAMSCTDAINLDGGGSTSMVINGARTVRPSDGVERAVVSAVVIKRK
jgi:Phosphodiester glycosidase